jgi:hypothetical protein
MLGCTHHKNSLYRRLKGCGIAVADVLSPRRHDVGVERVVVAKGVSYALYEAPLRVVGAGVILTHPISTQLR